MSSKEKSQPKRAKKTKPLVIPPPPANISEKADKDTKNFPSFLDGKAPNQVFHFKGLGLSYGSADPAHAASMVLSMVMLFIILLCLAVGIFIKDRAWLEQILNVISPVFLLTIGVAIGKSSSSGD